MGKCGFSRVDKWFEHVPETVLENHDYNLLWDYNIQTDHKISARRPDLVVINKQEQTCQVIDIHSSPRRHSCKGQGRGKTREIPGPIKREKMWSVRTQVLPVVIGALGTVPKRLESNLKRIGTNTSIEPLSLAQQDF